MNEPATTTEPATQTERGIPCPACGGVRWHVTHSRPSFGCVRRWRTCLGCKHKIRTAERIETGAHPERDAA